MNPSIAHALFTKGIDTFDIAKGHGCSEAEVVDALMKYREQKHGAAFHPRQTVEVRPQA
ncbi:MAG: hypothetical protein WC807_18660 [Hyphomicrobium sp.]|jgi:hypothetical protein